MDSPGHQHCAISICTMLVAQGICAMGFTSFSHFKIANFKSADTLSKCESKATLPKIMSQCDVGDWFVLYQLSRNVNMYFFRSFLKELGDQTIKEKKCGTIFDKSKNPQCKLLENKQDPDVENQNFLPDSLPMWTPQLSRKGRLDIQI